MTDSQRTPPDESVERGHELPTTDVRVLLLSGIGLVVLIAVTFLLIEGVMRLLAGASHTASSALAKPPVARPLAEPSLDVDLAAERQRAFAEQRAILRELKWVDESAGIARIPIDEATSITASQGLSAIQSPPATTEAKPNE